jgi:NADH:ubiquinone oxidoreductase subunit D
MFFLFFVVFCNLMRFAFGPQHPASHGVLTMIVFLVNEFVLFVDCAIGYLHRGTEKLLEFKSFDMFLPYFDRFDYCSCLCNEHLFVLCFESLLRCCLAFRCACLRCLLSELCRCFNGLLAVACNLFDMGALAPLLWAFEERYKLCLFFDFLVGCRMHCALFCLCGLLDELSCGMVDFLFL